jgi:hypothetical protein
MKLTIEQETAIAKQLTDTVSAMALAVESAHHTVIVKTFLFTVQHDKFRNITLGNQAVVLLSGDPAGVEQILATIKALSAGGAQN